MHHSTIFQTKLLYSLKSQDYKYTGVRTLITLEDIEWAWREHLYIYNLTTCVNEVVAFETSYCAVFMFDLRSIQRSCSRFAPLTDIVAIVICLFHTYMITFWAPQSDIWAMCKDSFVNASQVTQLVTRNVPSTRTVAHHRLLVVSGYTLQQVGQPVKASSSTCRIVPGRNTQTRAYTFARA